jgi:hypothetical protein
MFLLKSVLLVVLWNGLLNEVFGSPSFHHEIWGTVVPCHWEDAQGMLCPKNMDKVLIYPNAQQMDAMGRAGLPLPNGFRRRGKRDVFTDEDEDGRMKTFFGDPPSGYNSSLEHRISKRQTGDCNKFFGCDKDDSGEGGTPAKPFGYKETLVAAIRKQYGKKALEDEDEVVKKFFDDTAMDGFNQGSHYDYHLAKKEVFHPENGGAMKKFKEKLRLAKKKKPWLDAEQIIGKIIYIRKVPSWLIFEVILAYYF